MLIHGNKVLELPRGSNYSHNDFIKGISNNLDEYNQVIMGVYEIDGKLYYAKSASEDKMIQELIGSALSKELKLNAVDYKIGIDFDGNLYALSELFYDDNYFFSHPFQNSDIFLMVIKLFEIYKCSEYIYTLNDDMRKTILKLSALDIKMCQADRVPRNLMIKKDIKTSETSFAPIYDFGFSYCDDHYESSKLFYDNPYLIIRKNLISLKSLIKKYPEFYDYAKKMASVKMINILGMIEDENDIMLSDAQKRFYIEKDNSYSRVLKRL